MKRVTGVKAKARIDAMLAAERPFKNVPTEKLKFMIGVFEAGREMWDKKSPKYRDVMAGGEKMKAELALRGC
jgi:hypothetical protein